MSRSRQSGEMVARIAALDEYIAALLDDARRDERSVPVVAVNVADVRSGLRRYRAFAAAGMQLLLLEGAIDESIQLPAALQAEAGPAWRLGTLTRAGADEIVVDLARVIAPGLSFAPPGIGLRLAGRPWCLAVAEVGAVHEIDDANFALRAERSSRPWLAGMTRDTPRALLDPDALIGALLLELQA